ncbi:hypothetical protein CQS04_12075 [Chryseomicrobium excrementi]|uniref:RNA polymerase factor sigma C n=1 Tax=Chryseomicrobium excrementi TaxID=2041346 RepID=A0A2M9EXN0_9BACL|nr:sigma-70 family RNA polymerase sigma factor [Chryseomicrobium excrementi]PJK15964.1 hypothetical protein CQS04_12075 [Chryseomicrobium excrementi]
MAPVHTKIQRLELAMEEHGEMLMRLAMTYVKDRQIAEDITQDVFVKAFEKLEDYRGEASYKNYLCKLTINRCQDYFRSWHYKNAQVIQWWDRILQPTPSLDSVLMKQDASHELGQAILALPIRYREAIVLYYYQEFSVEEIATLLETPANTVKTRLKRARDRLKIMLEEEEFDGQANQTGP